MSVAQKIDHTLLKVDATRTEIEQLCEEAIQFKTFSVCINPVWVSLAHSLLRNTQVKVCSVVGFPLGATLDSVILAETEMVLTQGASEIDMVMNVSKFKSGDYNRVATGIQLVSNFAHAFRPETIVKVIVESAVLTEEEKRTAASMVVDSGADFLKTSTGYIPNPALIDDVALFKKVLPDEFRIKAAGGIRSYEMVKVLLDMGVNRIGASSTRKIIEEESSFF